ncbi:hypothetical protein ACFSO7_15810 [Bacillus sp. CGMCC 1.16607]|uniref:hypothetical protein n=1 Tax=Bacillus sp. CGMCC 1.16607 TaxID=3351842 RepID=UPI00363D9AF5
MNNQFEDRWKQLQQIEPTRNQKDALRARIRISIQEHPSSTISKRMIQWKSIVSVCLLLLVCGGLLWALLQDGKQPQPHLAVQPENEDVYFSWKLDDVYAEKKEEGWAILRKNKPLQVGSVNEVTEEEMKRIISSSPMFVDEKLEHFPYPTEMYIEHMKRMNVALRYHFFIPINEGNWVHFTFDYHQLEFAEIFQAMASLQIKGMEPYIHNEQLYVKHGYGRMIYPVGIQPISILPNKETYTWENASLRAYNEYLEKVLSSGIWQKKSIGNDLLPNTFVSIDGNQEITIILEGNKLTYEFVYYNQEE